jgi:hypothetical protein
VILRWALLEDTIWSRQLVSHAAIMHANEVGRVVTQVAGQAKEQTPGTSASSAVSENTAPGSNTMDGQSMAKGKKRVC